MWSILSRCRSLTPLTPDSRSSSSTEPTQTICARCQRGQLNAHGVGQDLFVVLARPQRDGRPPVAIPRDIPVARVRKPVAETVIANVLRDPNVDTSAPKHMPKLERCAPACLLVVCDELVDDGRHADEPRRDGAVDERGARPAARSVAGGTCERSGLTSSRRDTSGSAWIGR